MRFASAAPRLLATFVCLAAPAFSQAIPPGTAIPIVLTHSIAASHARPGDPVSAKTLQTVLLPGNRTLPAGTALTGRIVAASPFVFDAAPYAVQQPSVLSLQFDSISVPSALVRVSSTQVSAAPGAVAPVTLSLRAIAGPVASHEAQLSHGLDETDWSPARTLIGGDTTSPLENTILAPDGSTTGYRRNQGNFARLLASVSASSPALACDGTATEQSIALFSASACGVYGLNAVSMAGNGTHDNGAFILESRQRSVQLDAGTTALLEVMPR